MATAGPVLVGIKGIIQGEAFRLLEGKPVVVGRSRACDISLQRCRGWAASVKAGELPESARTVSRKHFKICWLPPGSVEIEDLSSNGTFVDGKRIDRIVLSDLQKQTHELQMGGGDIFWIEWK